MSGLSKSNNETLYSKLNEFLSLWPLERIQKLTLEEYTDVGNQNTFCYWLEYETEILGRIGGKPSNKFGIWKRKNDNQIVSEDFLFTNEYAWYKKYGDTPEKAFISVRNIIIDIIIYSKNKEFDRIDNIDIDSLTRWKIAFLYSNFNLMPIYKKLIIRTIAKHFEYINFKNARISELHKFIVSQKPANDDFFDFSSKIYSIATTKYKRNYYVIGTKYGDEKGNDVIDVSGEMYRKGVISTGFFWHINFSHLLGYDFSTIHSWIFKNIKDKSGKYETAKRTLGYFLNIKPGDLIALKSHGRYGDLTIIAYAEVLEVDNSYKYNDDELGHTIKVVFLEKNLKINTGLSYGQTIHKITPYEKEGHFEKIFGSYAIENSLEDEVLDDELFIDNNLNDDLEEVDRINEKETSDYERTMVSSQIVRRTHNKIQNEFAKKLKLKYPTDIVRTEHRFIDIKRENKNEVHLYEVKPFNNVYSCIRSGIGQLIDYSFKNSKQNKMTNLYIVGLTSPNENDLKFINYLKKSLNISFEYISLGDI